MSVAITIDNVVKRFGKDTIINGLSVDVRPGEFFTLLGPSGCGKTTLLRMIIGFNSIEGGTIKIDDQIINDIPTHLRNMGMVFQNYAIFPHMSVKDNVAFGLKNRKVAKEKMNALVDEILETVKIAFQEEIVAAVGKEKAEVELLHVDADLQAEIIAAYNSDLQKAVQDFSNVPHDAIKLFVVCIFFFVNGCHLVFNRLSRSFTS